MNLFSLEKKRTARQQEVQDDVIRVLTSYLKRAKAGQFIGVGVFAVNENRTIMTEHSTCDEPASLLGAAARLHFRAQSAMTADEFPSDVVDETPEE
jgi:hypothetical protein